MPFNCHRIDLNNVIKVADFGLSEDIYAKNYYRQSDTEECKVKLPIKWMALESLHDGVFSEKTDVVSLMQTLYITTGASPEPIWAPDDGMVCGSTGYRTAMCGVKLE